jgi:hypothetical protein
MPTLQRPRHPRHRGKASRPRRVPSERVRELLREVALALYATGVVGVRGRPASGEGVARPA